MKFSGSGELNLNRQTKHFFKNQHEHFYDTVMVDIIIFL